MSLAQWQQTIDVDLSGVFLLCRHVVPGMVARGFGRVINIASQLALKGGTSLTHYSAAKAGVLGICRSLAVELAPRGIRVNAVIPGLIETPQSSDPVNSLGPEGLERAGDDIPWGRVGRPEEVADVIWFLTSNDSRYVTGQELVVDGGLIVKMRA
jgi:3-oxoacyl-[acyl-carrier protein] reductase